VQADLRRGPAVLREPVLPARLVLRRPKAQSLLPERRRYLPRSRSVENCDVLQARHEMLLQCDECDVLRSWDEMLFQRDRDNMLQRYANLHRWHVQMLDR
jgi:hypothetical protein